jgi:hypothetical protein
LLAALFLKGVDDCLVAELEVRVIAVKTSEGMTGLFGFAFCSAEDG